MTLLLGTFLASFIVAIVILKVLDTTSLCPIGGEAVFFVSIIFGISIMLIVSNFI